MQNHRFDKVELSLSGTADMEKVSSGVAMILQNALNDQFINPCQNNLVIALNAPDDLGFVRSGIGMDEIDD